MASLDLLANKLFSWEGGFTEDKSDRGGATNMGVTIATWKKVGYDKDGDGDIDVEDIRLLTKADALLVLSKYYWNRWRANEIKDQKLANILVDWVWGSGKWGIIIPQQLLGVSVDGQVGPVTINKLNGVEPTIFLIKIYAARLDFIRKIIKNDPSQERFEKGWINRLNDFV